MKKYLAFTLTFLLCFITVFSSACSNGVKELGIQLSDRFTEGEIARCVWDLHVKDGKIYMASGDYDSNSGPTDICAYDLRSKKIEVSGRIQQEAVITFVEIEGTLYAPGTDPQGSGLKSDYYSLSKNGWEKHTVLPRALHHFDLTKFDGVLYAGIGGDYGFGTIVSSTDNGQTYNFLPLYKNGEEVVPLDNPKFSRCYDFYTLNGYLYALIYHYLGNGYDFEIYRLEDGKMQYFSDAETIDYTGRSSVKIFNAKAEHNGKVYIATNYLYKSSDGGVFEKIALPNDERVSDFIIEGDTMYVLSFSNNENDFSVNIYSFDLTDGTFDSLSTFNYPVPPLSFVKIKKQMYIGMGNKLEKHEKNGALLRVKI